jgi:putative sigma-54 modulation protein
MRIEVTGKHLEATEAIRAYAESKCAKLPRFFDGVMEIKVLLSQAERGRFEAELVVDAVKHDSFVASATGDSLYACIDLACDKMARQLSEFKHRLKDPAR